MSRVEPHITVTVDGKPLGFWESVEPERPTNVIFPDHAAKLLYGGFTQATPPDRSTPPLQEGSRPEAVPNLLAASGASPTGSTLHLEVRMTPFETRVYNRLPSLLRALFLTALDIRDILAIGSTRRRLMR